MFFFPGLMLFKISHTFSKAIYRTFSYVYSIFLIFFGITFLIFGTAITTLETQFGSDEWFKLLEPWNYK
jgi:hypothetical protein